MMMRRRLTASGPIRDLPARLRGGPSIATQRLVDEPTEHLVGVEVLLGDGARRDRVPRIIALDLLDRGNGLLHRGEWEDALIDRQDRGKAGILDDDRPAGGEVAGGAAAEPARLPEDVAVL